MMITAVVLFLQTCPAPEVARAFHGMGFVTEQVAPGSLTISAEPERFRDAFGIAVDDDPRRGATFAAPGARTRALPPENIPSAVRECVTAIEFQEPIEFGPPDY